MPSTGTAAKTISRVETGLSFHSAVVRPMLPEAGFRTGQETVALTEIELKLAAAPGDLPAVMRALEALGKRSSTTPSLLTSTYYDLPDLKLWRKRSVKGPS